MHFVFFTFEIFLVVQKWKADRFACLFPRKMGAELVRFAHSDEISSTSLYSHTVANKQLDFSLKCKRMYSQYTKFVENPCLEFVELSDIPRWKVCHLIPF